MYKSSERVALFVLCSRQNLYNLPCPAVRHLIAEVHRHYGENRNFRRNFHYVDFMMTCSYISYTRGNIVIFTLYILPNC